MIHAIHGLRPRSAGFTLGYNPWPRWGQEALGGRWVGSGALIWVGLGGCHLWVVRVGLLGELGVLACLLGG